MFESNAPKYKFGGSGSNLSLNSSQEELRQGPVRKPSTKPKEERKWVMESINKYFDVIVEEEEEEEVDGEFSEDEDEYEDEIDNDEFDDVDIEDDTDVDNISNVNLPKGDDSQGGQFRSSNKMRGLLSNVVSNLSRSVGNLASRQIVDSLKRNLGSQINLASSISDLAK